MTRALNERRPAPGATDAGQGSRAASKQNKSRGKSTAQDPARPSNSAVLPPRLGWAASLIAQADAPIPEYGSPEFESLPDHSPIRVASCVRAAEAWRTYWLPDEQARRLRAELHAAREYEEPAVWSQDVVDEVHRTANRPTYAQLCDLRGEPGRATRARERHLQVVTDA